MRSVFLSALLVGLIGCSGTLFEPPKADEFGNGGDPLSKRFEDGRTKALSILERVTMPAGIDRESLRIDVRETPPYRWVKSNPTGTCGRTSASPKAEVYLSYDECRDIKTVTDAAIHLIGESVHHIGIESDSEAARIAQEISQSWLDALGIESNSIRLRQTIIDGRSYLVGMLRRLGEVDLTSFIEAAPLSWTDEHPEGSGAYDSCLRVTHTSGLEIAYSGCAGMLQQRDHVGKMILHQTLLQRMSGSSQNEIETKVSSIYELWRRAGHPEYPHWQNLQIPFPSDFSPSGEAVWNGKELVSWSFENESLAYFDPTTQKWRFEKFANAFLPHLKRAPIQVQAIGTWINEKLLIYVSDYERQLHSGSGFVYDSKSRTWRAMTREGAPSPRVDNLFVSDDSQFVVWGGKDPEKDFHHTYQDGAVFSTDTEKWIPLPTQNSPDPRISASGVITRGKLFVWGGENKFGISQNDGGIYNFATQSWQPLSWPKFDLNPARCAYVIALGDKVLVYGGADRFPVYGGGIYDLTLNSWEQIPPEPRPSSTSDDYRTQLRRPLAAWTGQYVVLRGSQTSRFDPKTLEWILETKVATPAYNPSQSVHWTGMELLSWDPIKPSEFQLFYP